MRGALGVPELTHSLLFDLPTGTPQDPPGTPTVYGLPNRKNDLVLELIRTEGVAVYPGSVRYVQAARQAGLPCAVVTSSANAEQVLESAELSDLFDARVDGLVAHREGLAARVGQAEALRAHGADIVVTNLAELLDLS